MDKYTINQLYEGSTIFVITKKGTNKIFGIIKVRGVEYEDCFCQCFEKYRSKELEDDTLEKLEHEATKKFFSVK